MKQVRRLGSLALPSRLVELRAEQLQRDEIPTMMLPGHVTATSIAALFSLPGYEAAVMAGSSHECI